MTVSIDLSIPESSSTIKTVGWDSLVRSVLMAYLCCFRRGGRGEAEEKGGSAAQIFVAPDSAAVGVDDRPADGQADAQPRRLGAEKTLEYPFHLIPGYPAGIVDHGNAHGASGLFAVRRDSQPTPRRIDRSQGVHGIAQ